MLYAAQKSTWGVIMKKIIFALSIVSLAGCATVDSQADRVGIIKGNSAFSSQCQFIGNVVSHRNPLAFLDTDEYQQQVKNDLQMEALKLGADSVVVQTIDQRGGTGSALKCAKTG
ncbi:MAG TPA: hypothetical protein DEQ39_02755 [Atlantibacter hermannii]|nr:hypothetical protein [Atlantibacter hermannii]